ncbi:ribonuclease H [compost metagenome]
MRDQEIEECDVYIVADALNTVKSYEDWYFGWRRNAENGVWRNPKNKPVLNQEIIKETVSILESLKRNNYVKFIHINSHATKDSIVKFHQNFMKTNKVVIDLEVFKILLNFNDMIDKVCTKTRLEGRSKNENKKF